MVPTFVVVDTKTLAVDAFAVQAAGDMSYDSAAHGSRPPLVGQLTGDAAGQ